MSVQNGTDCAAHERSEPFFLIHCWLFGFLLRFLPGPERAGRAFPRLSGKRVPSQAIFLP